MDKEKYLIEHNWCKHGDGWLGPNFDYGDWGVRASDTHVDVPIYTLDQAYEVATAMETVKGLETVKRNIHKNSSDIDVIDKSTMIGRMIDLPEGTEYYSLGHKEEPNIGDKVYASLFAATRIGEVTEVLRDGICVVDGKATFMSDIKYIIVK